MTEVVVGLLMFLNGTMIEFTYKDSMSNCLKSIDLVYSFLLICTCLVPPGDRGRALASLYTG